MTFTQPTLKTIPVAKPDVEITLCDRDAHYLLEDLVIARDSVEGSYSSTDQIAELLRNHFNSDKN